MALQGLESYKTRITQLVFGVAFVAVVLLSFKGMITEHGRLLKILGGLSVLTAIYFWLDRDYWLLCPILMTLGIRVPGLPFSSNELGVILLFGIYFVRNALHREQSVKWDGRLLIVLPVFLWVMAVFVVNPTGINLFGSTSIGGRFYFIEVFGFLGLTALSTFRFSERDCRWLFIILAGASIVATVQSSFQGKFGSAGIYIGAEKEVRGHYELLGAVGLYALLFARYSLSDVLKSLWRLCSALVFIVLAIYSGKRAAFGRIVFIPFFRTLLSKRDFGVMMITGMFAVFILVFAMAGDGEFYQLPNSARRVLSLVNSKYGNQAVSGIHDLFRSEMRGEARAVIRANPWFGRKGFKMDRDETAWLNAGNDTFGGHAFAGNWHSLWYAFAADFGLPCLVFWIIFQLYYIKFIFKYASFCTTLGPYRSACFIYYATALLLSVVFSYTSGHSAFSSFETWTNYGFLLAIVQGGMTEWNQRWQGVVHATNFTNSVR